MAGENNTLCEGGVIFPLDPGNELFPPTQVLTLGVEINGNHTDILIRDFSDKLFIIITQLEKIGTLVSVKKDLTKSTNGGTGEVYSIKTLSGVDKLEYHLAGRYLAEQCDINKNFLLAVSMKDCSIETLKTLSNILLENKIW